MDPARELALKLAAACASHDYDVDVTVRRARAYLDFLTGTRDGEIINAARDLAEKMQTTDPRGTPDTEVGRAIKAAS